MSQSSNYSEELKKLLKVEQTKKIIFTVSLKSYFHLLANQNEEYFNEPNKT
jgi:hypothetical protein